MSIIDSSSLLTSQQRHAAAIAALDVEAPREVHVRRLASHFAAVIVTRPDESSLVESFVVLATRYRLAGLGEATLEALGERIERLVERATHDAELEDRIASRLADSAALEHAIERALTEFGPAHERCNHDAAHKHVQIAGHWLPGETITIDQQRFELTGSLCPQCGQPSAHAPRAMRCVDEIGCRWVHEQASSLH